MTNQGIQFEQSVIGGLLFDNAAWFDIKDLLTDTDFSMPQHQVIYKGIAEQLQAEKPADVVTLSEIIGIDAPYLANLALNAFSTANIAYYAGKVKEYAQRKQYAERLLQAVESLNDISKHPDDVIEALTTHHEKTITQKRGNGFMFTTIENTTIKPLDWLIEDFIEANSLTEVFGAPESGKSLLAIDWGLSVAAGIAWQGHASKQGAVFYIAGEGHNGLSRRFGAWGIDNNVDIGSLPFYRSEQAAALYDLRSAIDVERAINQVVTKNKVQPRLIIIDTLARNFGGGNENSTEDMNLFVAHIDKYLRVRFNATVLLVHHTGHGSAERGRGSSALKAAVDTEYSMVKNDADIINLTCTKMKDAAHPAPKSFQIRAIDLNITDEKGNPANGPVLIETAYAAPPVKPKTLGKNQQAALDVLIALYADIRQSLGSDYFKARVTVKFWQEKAGLDRFRFREAKSGLLERGFITIDDDDIVFLVEEQD